jgi:CelD/BcsL family acetyltransferase involved in cellulose biosynthesis
MLSPTIANDRATRPECEVVVVNSIAELEEHVTAWEDLAASALEPNPFYEPWMFLPALRAYGQDLAFRFVLVYRRPAGTPSTSGRLCGFFPLRYRRHYKGLPMHVVSLWQYIHCFLGLPLVREKHADACLAAFFDRVSSESSGAHLMKFAMLPGEGPFFEHLRKHLQRRGQLTHDSGAYARALLQAGQDSNVYLAAAISSRHRIEIRRKERRLAETGPLEFLTLQEDGDIEKWIESFLRLEASGWKGREGTALACSETDRVFFESITREAFRRGCLLFLALHVGGRPVAMACHFRSGRWSYYFKTAFDEAHSRCSPGFLLEVETVRRLQACSEIDWADSCTHPDNSMLNKLWLDRRTMRTVIASTGKMRGDCALLALALAGRIRRKLSRRLTAKRLPDTTLALRSRLP